MIVKGIVLRDIGDRIDINFMIGPDQVYFSF
jgi:hypothetical protein